VSTPLTNADLDFLRLIGISAESTFDDKRLAVAQRIARHQAPAQAKVSPQAARLELVRLTLRLLSEDREP